MNQSLGVSHFVEQADAISMTILVIMTIMSVGTWYVILTKSFQTLKIRTRINSFLSQFWSSPSLDSVRIIIDRDGAKDPFSRLVKEGLTAFQLHKESTPTSLAETGTDEDYLSRTLKRSIEENELSIEAGLSFVATVASSAPFIGLFGTVWGIYHALLAIGISGQGTLDKVAGPVGEALIMTAIGLVVAIPAAISYNFFARTNRSIQGRLDSFAHDVYTLMIKGVKLSPTERFSVQGSK